MQAHGLGCHLDVPSISYALALLRLPQLFMATYFVRGVETFSELAISLRRLNAFLTLPEPPAPTHLQGTEAGIDSVDVTQGDIKVCCFNLFIRHCMLDMSLPAHALAAMGKPCIPSKGCQLW